MSEQEEVNVVIETYPLIAPFAYAKIEKTKTGQTIYSLVESPLTGKEKKILNMIEDVITESLSFDYTKIENRKAASNFLRGKILDILQNYKIKLDETAFDKIFYNIDKEFFGYGIIEPLLADPEIKDISADETGIQLKDNHKK